MLKRSIWDPGVMLPAGTEKMLVDEAEAETIAVGCVVVGPGECTTARVHADEEEVYVVLSGRAEVTVGDECEEAAPGDVIYVPRNKNHFLKCISDKNLEYLYFANWPDAFKINE